MKIISLNIKGFKRDGKKEWVEKLCRTERPSFMLLQETKCGDVSDNWVEELWGGNSFDFLIKKHVVDRGVFYQFGTRVFSWHLRR